MIQSFNSGAASNIAALYDYHKPCYSIIRLASGCMWTEHEEAEHLRARFDGVNRSEFARHYRVPGGASMIYQHITGRRPISLEAAQAYARGFRCTLEEISPRLAQEARAALNMAGEQAPSPLLGAWDLLTSSQREHFAQAIKQQAETNRELLEELRPPPDVEHRTINVLERRMKQVKRLPFADRRRKENKNG